MAAEYNIMTDPEFHKSMLACLDKIVAGFVIGGSGIWFAGLQLRRKVVFERKLEWFSETLTVLQENMLILDSLCDKIDSLKTSTSLASKDPSIKAKEEELRVEVGELIIKRAQLFRELMAIVSTRNLYANKSSVLAFNELLAEMREIKGSASQAKRFQGDEADILEEIGRYSFLMRGVIGDAQHALNEDAKSHLKIR